jgi:hypothetical protein
MVELGTSNRFLDQYRDRGYQERQQDFNNLVEVELTEAPSWNLLDSKWKDRVDKHRCLSFIFFCILLHSIRIESSSHPTRKQPATMDAFFAPSTRFRDQFLDL